MSTPEKWLDAAALDLADMSAHNLTHAEWLEVCAQARAALSLRDELASVRAELATASDMNATLARDNELLSRKLAQAEQERDDMLSSLRSAEQDGRATVGHMGTLMIAAAAAQAENVRLREALKALRPGGCLSNCAAFHGRKPCQDCRDAAEIDAALATPPGSREALREMLTKMGEQIAWECGGVQENIAKRVAVNVSRLLPDEGGQP